MISTAEPKKKISLGVLLYRYYHAPKGFLKKWWQRGVADYVLDHWHHQKMKQAVTQLHPMVSPPTTSQTKDHPLKVYFLSGSRFWHQTCLCFYSLQQQTDLNLQLVVCDDGTLTPQYQNQIQRIFPTSEFLLAEAINEQLDRVLPVSQFPTLRARRLVYPNLRKLTDIHIFGQGWKLVLDSDMIFFRPPTQLLNWFQQPQRPCHMVDVETAYGYSPELMTSLAQASIPERVNVGVCGLNSSQLDWQALEDWCRILIEKEGTHYYQEQALIAMLMAQQDCEVVSAEDYIVQPLQEEVRQPQACLHHYVAASKPWYFRYGWKQIITT